MHKKLLNFPPIRVVKSQMDFFEEKKPRVQKRSNRDYKCIKQIHDINKMKCAKCISDIKFEDRFEGRL